MGRAKIVIGSVSDIWPISDTVFFFLDLHRYLIAVLLSLHPYLQGVCVYGWVENSTK